MKTNVSDKIEEEIKLIVSRISGIKPDKIISEAHLYNELNIDSIKGIELVVALQEKYGIRIKDSRLPELTTTKIIVEEIRQLLTKKKGN